MKPAQSVQTALVGRALAILDAEIELRAQRELDAELLHTRQTILSESSGEGDTVACNPEITGTTRLVHTDSDVWDPVQGSWSLIGQDCR